MNEIGGYFELESLIHNEYYPDLIDVNTARNAVAYLINTKKIHKIYLPSFLCDSIYRLCEREDCSYELYEIADNFQPGLDKQLLDNEWIYIVNYFGEINNVKELKQKYNHIIFDNVQAFFQRPLEGIDTIYSCRKFFGVPDGAYLASDMKMILDEDFSMNRMNHIIGRFENTASEYYTAYAANEESFYNLPLRKMSRLTHNILGAIDYEKIKSIRERNFRYLHEKLGYLNRLMIHDPVGPFAYPLYLNDGMSIKKKLASDKIYIATLWPEAIRFGGIAKEYSENILPLPCDQRYEVKDMEILVNKIKSIVEFN